MASFYQSIRTVQRNIPWAKMIQTREEFRVAYPTFQWNNELTLLVTVDSAWGSKTH